MTPKLAQKVATLIASLEKLRKSKKNPFYNSNYADINQLLAQVKPLCKEIGLTILQPIVDDHVVTVVMDNDTGEIFPNFKNTEEMRGLKIIRQQPQEKGSEITYYRRYGLQSLLLLEAEDDDANKTKRRNAPVDSGKYHRVQANNNDSDFGL